MTKIIRWMALAGLSGFAISFLPLSSGAAELTLKVLDKQPPQEVDGSIRKILQSKAVQLLEGGTPVYEFWFRTEIPLKSRAETPAKTLEAIAEATFCGVVSVGKEKRDYKDNDIAPGLYTARFSLQPQDGDHLGTSEHPYFLVLIPVKADIQLNGITAYKPMVKASGKATASGHPVVLNLRPVSSEDGEYPKLSEPVADQKCVRLKVPAKAPEAGQQTSVIFELVYQGKGKVQ